jgi:hypothetical protein
LPIVNHGSIVAQPMNGLRRNDAQPELLMLVLLVKSYNSYVVTILI